MRSRCLSLVLFLLASLASYAGDVEAQRLVLLGEGEDHEGLLRIPDQNKRLQAIQALQKDASPEAVAALLEFLKLPDSPKHFKQQALLALGKIGSRNAVQAIAAFEAWAEARFHRNPTLTLGKQDHPSPHFSPFTVNAVAECLDGTGTKWVLVPWARLGTLDLWIGSVDTSNALEPVLLDLPLWSNPQAASEMLSRKLITLNCGPGEAEFSVDLAGEVKSVRLSEIKRDSDDDGLTDLQEARMGTQPDLADTDGDGTLDGDDPAPQIPRTVSLDEDAQIRQAVFSLYFATTSGMSAILLDAHSSEGVQEYRGYMGPVLLSPSTVYGAVNFSISVKEHSRDKAVANFSDYEGPLAASGNTIELKKLYGKWIVVDYRMDYIS